MNQNRRIIQELVSALVNELAELQNFCQDKEKILQKVNLDYDWMHSLQRLKSLVTPCNIRSYLNLTLTLI